MGSLYNTISQAYPPAPKFTEKDLPDFKDKVYVITGANTGVGKELAQLLYSKNAKIYIAARNESKATQAIKSIQSKFPSSTGILEFLHLDLADLSTISVSAQKILSKEKKLHVLFNNAGVMNPENGSKSAQGYELQLAVNNIGTFMFTKLLTPLLITTAKSEPSGTVRVIWVSSSAAEKMSPKGGVPIDNLDYHIPATRFEKYAISKAGNYLHAAEFARRYKKDGIVSIALNPGNLDSELWRTQGSIAAFFLRTFLLHKPIKGAYTELYAGLSPDITLEKSGEWVVPWGRIFKMTRKDLIAATKTQAEGGSGIALQFWEWNETQIEPFLSKASS